MKIIQFTLVFMSFCTYAQSTENLLKDHFNPCIIEEFDTTTFYAQVNILNPEFGIHNNKIASIFKLKNSPFQLAYQQYGYKLFKDSKYSISSTQKLNSEMNFGLNINFHQLNISGAEKHHSLSFDLGYSYKTDTYEFHLFLENPLNNNYVKNDLESRFILSSLYYWNPNLYSNLEFEESLHPGFHIKHQLIYSYQNFLSLGILQAFHPFEYGFRLGCKKGAFQIYSQYRKLTWTNATGFALIYQPGNE